MTSVSDLQSGGGTWPLTSEIGGAQSAAPSRSRTDGVRVVAALHLVRVTTLMGGWIARRYVTDDSCLLRNDGASAPRPAQAQRLLALRHWGSHDQEDGVRGTSSPTACSRTLLQHSHRDSGLQPPLLTAWLTPVETPVGESARQLRVAPPPRTECLFFFLNQTVIVTGSPASSSSYYEATAG